MFQSSIQTGIILNDKKENLQRWKHFPINKNESSSLVLVAYSCGYQGKGDKPEWLMNNCNVYGSASNVKWMWILTLGLLFSGGQTISKSFINLPFNLQLIS